MNGFGETGKQETQSGSSGSGRSTTQQVVAPHPAVAEAVIGDLSGNDGYFDTPLRNSHGEAISRDDLPAELEEQLPDNFEAVSFEDIFNVRYDGSDGYPDGVTQTYHPEKGQDETSEDVEDNQAVYPGRAGHLYHAGRYFTAWYYPELVEAFNDDVRVRVGKPSSRSKRGFESDEERYQFVGFSTASDEKGDVVVGTTEDGQSRNTEGKILQAVKELVSAEIVEDVMNDETDYGMPEMAEEIREIRQEREPWNRD